MSAHFISYSSADALEFALRLRDELEAGPPSVPVWLDKRDIEPGQDWDREIDEALKSCRSLIFVMTRDSVEDASVCKREWTRALSYKKPIVPIKLEADAEMPFRLAPRHHIDFTGWLDSQEEFNAALARLRKHIAGLASPAGALQALRDRLADASRDLRREDDPSQQARIRADIEQLKADIARQEEVVRNPQAAARRAEERIARGLERERRTEREEAAPRRGKFVNEPPGQVPAHFQDRHVETGALGGCLRDESLRLVTVVGPAGAGKTALVCRLLGALEGGRLPDDGGPLEVGGVVYLSAAGTRRLTMPNLYADLSKLLPDEAAAYLGSLFKDPKAGTEVKMWALLSHFTSGRTVVLLDNFEEVLDPQTGCVRDAELADALRALLSLPRHTVKVILTTRLLPRDLALVQPSRQRRLELEDGLRSPYAERLLRELDADGKVGLQSAPDELLGEAGERTGGFPRALEALYAILSADRSMTLGGILDETKGVPLEAVVPGLVAEAVSRLDPGAQQVMQALAVYGRPVTAAAVDYLLQPYLPGAASAAALARLAEMQFARGEAERFYLHPSVRAYALSRIPPGEPADRAGSDAPPPYTRYALLHRAAEYFRQARRPPEEWKKIEDLAPQLAEFDLRCEGGEYDAAAAVLLEIDFDYLFLWGYYRQMAEMHESLRGKLGDPSTESASVGNLGTAYLSLGERERALACYEEALRLARQVGDRWGEGASLGNIGTCQNTLGQTERAIEYFQQSLAISREVGDRRAEATSLANLGDSYLVLGQPAEAVKHYEEALALNREIKNRAGEGAVLGSLCWYYCNTGEPARGIPYGEQALDIARDMGNRGAQVRDLNNLADAHLFDKNFDEAIRYALESVKVAGGMNNPAMNSGAHGALALARLYAGDLTGARAAAEVALHHSSPTDNAPVLTFLGVITVRQGDAEEARKAFTEALAQCEAALRLNERNGSALYSKGLALVGLAVCGDAGRVAEAAEAYRAARAVNKDAGVIRRTQLALDALAEADGAGVVSEVRAVVAGG